MSARPVTIRVKQLKELQKAMKAGESALEPKQVTPVLYRALQLFYDEALRILRENLSRRKSKTPLTGNLEKSLVLKPGKSSKIANAWCKDKSRHAHLIEYGHDIWRGGKVWKGGKFDHTLSNAVSGGRVKPYPFFRPALDATRAKVRKAIRVGLQELLAKSMPGKPGNAGD